MKSLYLFIFFTILISCKKSNEYNQTLSQRRADGIANFFISEGISKEKIKTIGYGEEKPLVKNDNDQDRATNRRVELRIIK